jgi:hypothetical protein
MDQQNPNQWRQMFEPRQPFGQSDPTRHAGARYRFDDGHSASRGPGSDAPHRPLSPEAIADEAAMALALDTQEYRPWILQRGGRPAMMIDFRHFEPRSGLWSGWALSYPLLIGLHYTGKEMLSLDFGTRHIVLQGDGLDELARHIQQGSVVSVQEWTPEVWSQKPQATIVTAIRQAGSDQPEADRGPVRYLSECIGAADKG